MDMLFIKNFYSYGYWFWIILFAHLNDKHWFIIFFPQVWKVLLDTFHIGILFMFHYTFIHTLKSLNTSSSRFILNIKIHPQLLYRPNSLQWTLVLWLPRYQSLIQAGQNYEAKNLEILASIHLFPGSLNELWCLIFLSIF